MTALTVQDLHRDLGDGRHLTVEYLAVGAGERLVLFGPNGAGKSTLIRLLAGTLGAGGQPEAAYLPQRPYLFRGSARRNLELGLAPRHRSRALDLATRLGIGAILDRPARALSGGERQRLALARTLARPEAVVLLDEPLAAVDARHRPTAAEIIDEALDDRTAVIVTHDRTEAAILAPRLAVIVDGEILQTGPVEEVFSLPIDDRVAAVVGIGNIVKGAIVDTEDGLVAIGAGPLAIWGLGDGAAGGEATALFGAEAVTLYAGTAMSSGSARNHWTGRVTEMRPAGRLVEVVVDCGIRVVALVTPGSLTALDLEEGHPVTLSVKATAINVVPG